MKHFQRFKHTSASGYTVPPSAANTPLQHFVAASHNVSRSTARLLIFGNRVVTSSGRMRPEERVRVGERVVVLPTSAAERTRGESLRASERAVEVFRGSGLVALEKPYRAHTTRLAPARASPVLPLGRFASGVTLFALTPEAARVLGRQCFADGERVGASAPTTVAAAETVLASLNIVQTFTATVLPLPAVVVPDAGLIASANLVAVYKVQKRHAKHAVLTLTVLLGSDTLLRRGLEDAGMPCVGNVTRGHGDRRARLHCSEVFLRNYPSPASFLRISSPSDH